MAWRPGKQGACHLLSLIRPHRAAARAVSFVSGRNGRETRVEQKRTRERTRDRVSGRNRKRACGVRWIVRTPCRGRRSRRGKTEDPWALRAPRRGLVVSSPALRSGKSAAPASPAAARRRPCPPGGTLAVPPRPETESRVGLLVGHRDAQDLLDGGHALRHLG